MSEFDKYVIIVSGGTGNRMESQLPKQFLELKGLPILMHSISAFQRSVNSIKIILVLNENHLKIWEDLCKKYNFTLAHTIVFGGKSRFHSVQNGLEFIFNQIKQLQSSAHINLLENTLIAIHDGVRPLIKKSLINRTFDLAQEKGSAVPAIESKDSIRTIDKNGLTKTINRNSILLIQTPQTFQALLLQKAYRQEFIESFTDDASVIEKSGYPIHITKGDIRNIKITYPSDLAIAELY